MSSMQQVLAAGPRISAPASARTPPPERLGFRLDHRLSSWCPPALACWAIAVMFSCLSSDVSEIKLVFSIPAHRPTQTSRRTEKSP
jgi:hypothetical protein